MPTEQILYWNDVAAGVRHATLVHQSGHILLRDVPADDVPAVTDRFREFRNTLENVEKVTAEDLTRWLEEQGYEVNPNFNPPLVAYTYAPPVDEDAFGPGDSIGDMSIKSLRALGTELGIENPSNLKKPDLIKAIEDAQAAIEGKGNEGGDVKAEEN